MNVFENLKETVIDKELCTSCGTCIGVCPINTISFKNEKIINQESKCINCGKCIKSCPGKEFDFKTANKFIFGSEYSNINKKIGYYKNIFCGYSLNEKLRQNSASGGVISELLTWLIDSGQVDGVVVIQNSHDNPLQYKAKLVSTIEEIENAAQSKYKLIPTNEVLSEILRLDGKYAYVGLPCQIQGLQKAMHIEPELKEKIYVSIGLFCGFNISERATDYLLKKGHIKKDNIKQVLYRKTVDHNTGFYAIDHSGKDFFINKHGYTFLNLIYSPKRCWKCYDFTSEFADISVGDAWEQGKGWSRIITRTETGQNLINKAMLAKRIFTKDSSPEEIYNSQRTILNYKKVGFWTRKSIMKDFPDYSIDDIKTSNKNRIKSSVIYYAQQFGQTTVCKSILNIIPIKILEKASIKLRK